MVTYTKQVVGTKMKGVNLHGIPLQKKYRNHFEIIALMLEAVKGGGARRFSIMRRTSVNSAQLKKHLGSLMKMGLVEIDVKGGRTIYKATDRGLEFLRHYNILQQIMWNGNLARVHTLHGFMT